MFIAHISTHDPVSNDNRQLLELHRSLLRSGHMSRCIVLNKNEDDETVIRVKSPEGNAASFGSIVQRAYIDQNRTTFRSDPFRFPYPGWDVSSSEWIRGADLIHVHDVAGFLSPVGLQRVFASGRPVVWTLYGQEPMTGGCHYAGRCEKYCDGCVGCPQLIDDPYGLPSVLLEDKTALYRASSFTAVAADVWILECAEKSKVFRGRQIRLIRKGIDASAFKVPTQREARGNGRAWKGILKVFIAGPCMRAEGRDARGAWDAFRSLLDATEIRKLVQDGTLQFIAPGIGNRSEGETGLPFIRVPYPESTDAWNALYESVDLYFAPVLTSGLPAGLLEAMCCAVPVMTLDRSDTRDLLESGEEGWLVEPGDFSQMANALSRLAADRVKIREAGNAARAAVEVKCGSERMVGQYLALYGSLMENRATRTGSAVMGPRDSGVLETLWHSPRCEAETASGQMGPFTARIYDDLLSWSLRKTCPGLLKAASTAESEKADLRKKLMLLEEKVSHLSSDRSIRIELVEELAQRFAAVDQQRSILSNQNRSLREEIRCKDSEIERLGLELNQIRWNLFHPSDHDQQACKIDRESERLPIEGHGIESYLRPTQMGFSKEQIWGLEETFRSKQAELDSLALQLSRLEADRIARGDQIALLRDRLTSVAEESEARLEQITVLNARVKELERELNGKCETEGSLLDEVGRLEADRIARGDQIALLRDRLTSVAEESEVRLEQITVLNARVKELERELNGRCATEGSILEEMGHPADGDHLEGGTDSVPGRKKAFCR